MLNCDNPFWQFSLTIYAAPDVSGECLALQDTLDIDVNILLFVAWLGRAHKVKLTAGNLLTVEAKVRRWRDTVVRPLRATRRGIKPMPEMSDAAVKLLRSDLARAELRAEQIEQAMLFELTDELIDGAETTLIAKSVQDNVSAVLQQAMLVAGKDAGGPPKASRLMAEAVAYRPAVDTANTKKD